MRHTQANDLSSEALLEEPFMISAFFKYAILRAGKIRKDDFTDVGMRKPNEYTPDQGQLLKILNENAKTVPNLVEICANLPRKQLCPLDLHEQVQQILLTQQSNSQANNLTKEAERRLQQEQQLLQQPIQSTLLQTQLLVNQIDSITESFRKAGVVKCDQDADLRELENKLSSENGAHSTRDGNLLGGSSDNLSNAGGNNAGNGIDGMTATTIRCIQKRSRRTRADQMVKRVKEDTKNLLRNYGNAQSRFVLSSGYSKKIMDKFYECNEEKIEDFKKWVMQQKLENFEQFKNIWHVQEDDPCKDHKQLFREICFDFYENHASVYVLGSQMRSEDTRKTHIKYICRFLDGIVHPSSFYYFKKN